MNCAAVTSPTTKPLHAAVRSKASAVFAPSSAWTCTSAHVMSAMLIGSVSRTAVVEHKESCRACQAQLRGASAGVHAGAVRSGMVLAQPCCRRVYLTGSSKQVVRAGGSQQYEVQLCWLYLGHLQCSSGGVDRQFSKRFAFCQYSAFPGAVPTIKEVFNGGAALRSINPF